MAKTFLVDAHNALFRLWPEPPKSGEDVRRVMVARAKDALRRQGIANAVAHLVFDTTRDGRARAGTHGRDGAVTWSYADGSADEEIVELVREHEGRRDGTRISVVSDDRELRGRAAQLGAEVVRVGVWFADTAEVAGADESPAGRPEPPGIAFTAKDFGFASDAIDLDDDPDEI